MKSFLKANWFKISCLLAVVIFAVVLSSVLLGMRSDRIWKEREIAAKKEELEQKDYFIKRRAECLNIYKVESDKYNNVRSWRYDETADSCSIVYKETKPKTKAECEDRYLDEEGKIRLFSFLNDYLDCLDGNFANTF